MTDSATDRALAGRDAVRGHPGRTALVTSIALFMVSLDSLVVTNALPRIRTSFGAGLDGLEWIVNAYTLVFATLLLTASTIADRFGRKPVFAIGLGVFTAGSLLAAVSGDTAMLVTARCIQGAGAAAVLPLTLTLLSAAFPPDKRGAALGIWGAIGGLAVAIGPVVGGLVIHTASWTWIFWVNVPIGVVLLALVPSFLTDSRGVQKPLDLVGTVLVSGGLLLVVLGVVEAQRWGWASLAVLGCEAGGIAALAAFLLFEARTASPMLPLRFLRNRELNAINIVSLLMYFGMFGSIFLVTQYIQDVQGAGPLGAGVRLLAWTGMTMIAAPVAGILSDSLGGKPLLMAGMILQTLGLGYLAVVAGTSTSFLDVLPGFMLNGAGMGLYFGPAATVALGAVDRWEEGIASGANNAIRELGGVFGIAALGSVFASNGGYDSPSRFVDGVVPSLWIGTAVVALGAVACLALRSKVRDTAATPPDATAEPADTVGPVVLVAQPTP